MKKIVNIILTLYIDLRAISIVIEEKIYMKWCQI